MVLTTVGNAKRMNLPIRAIIRSAADASQVRKSYRKNLHEN